ncbi:MAG: NAD(P)/FAD-dependent oxidoreductase [Candidatus Bathyarchaeota archaeon]|jgi:geranylgeranyl reductase family protein
MRNSEVAVVGGGPCGSFTAINLARRGCEVQVYEEHPEVGVPSHCAGHLSIKGLNLLGLEPLPSKIVQNVFQEVKFTSPSGRELGIRFSQPVTCAINRSLFDKHLASVAERHGVTYFLKTKVESLITKNRTVKGIRVRSGKEQEKIATKFVVDAEGVSCSILKQAGLSAFDPRTLVKSVQVEVEKAKDLCEDVIEVFLGRKYAPGFFAWLIPIGDGKAKIGLATKWGDPREFLHRLLRKHPKLSKRLSKAKTVKTNFHCIPLGGSIPKPYSDRFLVVGDAASQVKPTTGGGVIFGMRCGRIAAEVASDALTKGKFSANHLEIYQKKCNKLFGSEINFMLRFRKLFFDLPDNHIDRLIHYCRQFGLDDVIRRVQEPDFQRRALLSNLWHPTLHISLLYLLILYLSVKHRNHKYTLHKVTP